MLKITDFLVLAVTSGLVAGIISTIGNTIIEIFKENRNIVIP